MKLDFAVCADYAAVDAAGKLTIVGIFDFINAATFPASWPDMVLLLRLKIHRSELGTAQKVVVKLATEDGHQLIQVEGEFNSGPVPGKQPAVESSVNHILRFQNMTFPRPGVYTFDILINNSVAGTVPLALNQRKP